MYTDKIAGLQSHQFVRDENRYAMRAFPIKEGLLPRQPHIGNNARNNSHKVFTFGNSMAYADGT